MGLGPAGREGAALLSPEAAAGNLLSVIETLGPEESGGFFDWKGEAVPF